MTNCQTVMHATGKRDYTCILKRWVRLSRKWLAAAAGVIFLAVFVGVAFPDFFRTKEHMAVVRGVFALWTIAVPIWFFVEGVYGVKRDNPPTAEFEMHRADFKAMQEAARSVWAGCAASVGILLLKLSS